MSSSSKAYSDTDSDQGTQSSDYHVVPSTQPDEIHEEKETNLHPVLVMTGHILNRIFSPILRIIFAPQAQKTFIKTFVLIILVSWVLLTSFTAYITFYQRYIPKNAHLEPIYFQYDSIRPQGHIQFLPPNQALLRSDQAYDVSIQLHVPTSDINFQMGNFMIQVEMLSQNGSVLAHSNRPAILRYQSSTHRILRVIAKALPLLVGWSEESQKINIHLIESFIEKKNTPMKSARITLSNPQVQIYDAKLSIVADFRGLRYYMYHKKITTAFIFMILFTIIELICASIAWKSFGKNLWDKIHEAFTAEEQENGYLTE